MANGFWFSRPFRAGLFGVIILSFLLPFLDSSFEEPASTDPAFEIDRSGAELVLGKRWADVDSLKRVAQGFAIDLEQVRQRIPPEPFAIIALAALCAGLFFVLREPRWAPRHAAAAAGIALACLFLLALSPSVAYVGIAVVEVQLGFWACAAMVAAAFAIHWMLALRELPATHRSPPPPH